MTPVRTAEPAELATGGFLPIEPCQSILEPFEQRWIDLVDEASRLAGEDWIQHPDLHLTTSGWHLAPVRYFGADHPGGAAIAPVLAELVARDHRVKGAAYYALGPGTELAPHRGNPIGLGRFHLGLRVPEECGIRVGRTTRAWSEGGWLAFDDSVVHHAWNHSQTSRLVLILDLEHPDVPVPVGAHLFQWASRTFYLTMWRFPRARVLLGRVNWLSRLAQRVSNACGRLLSRGAWR